MKCKKALCSGFLCLLLCLGLQAGLCEPATTPALLSPQDMAEGAALVEAIQDEASAQQFASMLQSIDYRAISDGKTITFPFDDEDAALCFRTLDLDTLVASDVATLQAFDEGEALLRVLPRMGGFFVLTNRALYCYDDALTLTQATSLPDALIEMEGMEERLRSSGEISPDGARLLFEADGADAGIYLCALTPDAVPALTLPGTTYADANGTPLEGYREGRFVTQDRIAAYLWGPEGRIVYEVFDLDGHSLHQSYVFNQPAGHISNADKSPYRSQGYEAEHADGIIWADPASLSPMITAIFPLDYQTLQIERITPQALTEANLQFVALDGTMCVLATEDWDFAEQPSSDIGFFTLDLASKEEETLPFVLHDVAEFTAALAPGGRILFVCRNYGSGTYFRGVFALP